MKFCKDCLHFAPIRGSDLCGHPISAARVDPAFLVRGEGTNNAYTAHAMRAGICGVEGKHWTAIISDRPKAEEGGRG